MPHFDSKCSLADFYMSCKRRVHLALVQYALACMSTYYIPVKGDVHVHDSATCHKVRARTCTFLGLVKLALNTYFDFIKNRGF